MMKKKNKIKKKKREEKRKCEWSTPLYRTPYNVYMEKSKKEQHTHTRNIKQWFDTCGYTRSCTCTWICVFNRKGNKCSYTYADKNSPCSKADVATSLLEIDSSLDTFAACCASLPSIVNLIKMKMVSSNKRRCFQVRQKHQQQKSQAKRNQTKPNQTHTAHNRRECSPKEWWKDAARSKWINKGILFWDQKAHPFT